MSPLDTAPSRIAPGAIELLPIREIRWGLGTVSTLGDVLDTAGVRRAALLTTRSLVAERRLLAMVTAAGGERIVGRVDELPAHVPGDRVAAAAGAIRELGADAVVAFGGGSVIDAAKAVAATVIDGGGRLPVIAVPTTLSGAEFSDHFGVTAPLDGRPVKRTHTRVDVTPAAVLLDGRLTSATHAWLWAGSALKAIDHAVEGLLGSAPRPVVDELALVGLRFFARRLPVSIDPGELDHRQAAQLAAWRCYYAPASTTLGLSHRLGHVLGGTYGVPHALTSGITLPPVLAATASRAPARAAQIARALRGSGPLDLDAADATDDPAAAAALLTELVNVVGLPTRLRDVGVDRTAVPAIADAVADIYPDTAAQLGTDAHQRLHQLVADAW